MKQYTKKTLLTWLLAAAMLLSLFPTAAFAIESDAEVIPDDAVEYNGHYYYIYEEECTWTEAEARCEALGGYLATITSKDEQAFIDEYNGSLEYLWIGGYREDDNTVWMWVTGEAWGYTNWDEGEPNNSSNVVSNENRIVLWSDGYWNDLNDENTWESAGYICEWGDTGNVFDDVQDSSVYYYYAVYWAYDNGITTGTTTSTFSPDGNCTRAQFVTFLWRLAGSPTPTTTSCKFTDVSSSGYYYKAVLWAAENGVTEGTTGATFSPNVKITRAQAVTMIYRYAGSPSVSTTNPFTDTSSSAYYYDAMLWAVKNGITSGTSKTTFSPGTTCSRAMMVTFLYRYAG